MLLSHLDVHIVACHLPELLILLLSLWDLEVAHLLLDVWLIIFRLLIVILVLMYGEAARWDLDINLRIEVDVSIDLKNGFLCVLYS